MGRYHRLEEQARKSPQWHIALQYLLLVLFGLTLCFGALRLVPSDWLTTADAPLVYIAVGSAPEHVERRQAIRTTWAKDGVRAQLYFYTEQATDDVVQEQATYQDILFYPRDPASAEQYQRGRHHYVDRAFYQMRHFLEAAQPAQYFLRVDDDVLLCLPRLEAILSSRDNPVQPLFWGRYWHASAAHPQQVIRADESFMLFSADIVRWLVQTMTNDMVVLDHTTTFAMHWAWWSHLLRMEIWDDAEGIDSQQGYLTSYLHDATAPKANDKIMCRDLTAAHHVSPAIMQQVYPAMKQTLPQLPQTMSAPSARAYKFTTERYAKALPKCTCTSLHTLNHKAKDV